MASDLVERLLEECLPKDAYDDDLVSVSVGDLRALLDRIEALEKHITVLKTEVHRLRRKDQPPVYGSALEATDDREK